MKFLSKKQHDICLIKGAVQKGCQIKLGNFDPPSPLLFCYTLSQNLHMPSPFDITIPFSVVCNKKRTK